MFNEDCNYEIEISDCEVEEIIENQHFIEGHHFTDGQHTIENQHPEIVTGIERRIIEQEVITPSEMVLPFSKITERLSAIEQKITLIQAEFNAICDSSSSCDRILPYRIANLESDLTIAFGEIRAVGNIFTEIQQTWDASFRELKKDVDSLKRLNSRHLESEKGGTISPLSLAAENPKASSSSSTVYFPSIPGVLVPPVATIAVESVSSTSTPQSIPLTPPCAVCCVSDPELIAKVNNEMMLLHYSLHRMESPKEDTIQQEVQSSIPPRQQTPQPELDSEKTGIFARMSGPS